MGNFFMRKTDDVFKIAKEITKIHETFFRDRIDNIENFNNSFSITDVDLVLKSCNVEIIPFCEKSPMRFFSL